MICKAFMGADVNTTGELDRVTAVTFIQEGSRGGYGIVGEHKGKATVVYAWPKNGVGEMMMHAYHQYVNACDDESCDAYGIQQWADRDCPKGPIG